TEENEATDVQTSDRENASGTCKRIQLARQKLEEVQTVQVVLMQALNRAETEHAKEISDLQGGNKLLIESIK
ncbi:hypothetical protein ACHAWX_002564, partial [Stephanocyclus meneghinianus]